MHSLSSRACILYFIGGRRKSWYNLQYHSTPPGQSRDCSLIKRHKNQVGTFLEIDLIYLEGICLWPSCCLTETWWISAIVFSALLWLYSLENRSFYRISARSVRHALQRFRFLPTNKSFGTIELSSCTSTCEKPFLPVCCSCSHSGNKEAVTRKERDCNL